MGQKVNNTLLCHFLDRFMYACLELPKPSDYTSVEEKPNPLLFPNLLQVYDFKKKECK